MRYLNILMVAALCGALQGCFPVVAAGVGAGVMMADDRRTSGAYIEDQGIEMKAGSRIGDQYSEAHVNITSFNRIVLLTGEASNEEMKNNISKLAASIENVKQVHNHLAIAGNSGLASRSSDTIITGDVKTRLIGTKSVNANHIKVVTEAGIVYLMGKVYRTEADAAAEVASTTKGVRGVVKVFEYLD
jgi:osmotically-inducible protein OsmY